jgi:hypothetical protein
MAEKEQERATAKSWGEALEKKKRTDDSDVSVVCRVRVRLISR